MPWIDDTNCPDYHFLGTGELQYRNRWGQFAIAGGCTVADWFVFQEFRAEAVAILAQGPEGVSVEECYASHARFQYLCRWCLEASAIDPDTIAVRQVRRLLFSRVEAGQHVEAPLAVLNSFPEPRHPVGPGGQPISDKVALLFALAAQCSSVAEFEALATSLPAREVMGVLDDLAWASKSPEQQAKAQMYADRDAVMERLDSVAMEVRRGPQL